MITTLFYNAQKQRFMNAKKLVPSTLLAFLLLASINLLAQNAPAKVGKVSPKDFELTAAETEMDAHAIKLFDYAYLNYRYQDGFSTNLSRHYRIKILDEEGLEWADVEIPYYKNFTTQERVGSIKAFVYNLDNGNVTKTKLENKDIFDEQVDKNRHKRKFAMPNAKVGSIIEVKYEFNSEFWSQLDPWLFQESIPVRHSEFVMAIPEYFVFNTNFKGYEFGQITTNDQSKNAGRLSLGAGQGINCVFTNYHWVAENIPPFVGEAYMTTARNYLGRIEFELAQTNFPNSFNQSLTTSWEALAGQLATSEDFGLTINRADFLQDQAKRFTADATEDKDKVVKIYEGAKQLMKWNKKYRRFASVADIKKAMKAETGNSAEINFALTCLLKVAGFKAYPVLISTRSHGYVNQYMPSFNQFNHVVSAVKVGEDVLILDATDPLVPATFTPKECLNSQGLMLIGEKYSWVSLKARNKYKMAVQAKLKIGEDGTLSGTIKEARDGYAGYRFRQAFYSKGQDEDYVKALQEEVEGLAVETHDFQNMDNIYKRAEANYEVSLTDQVMMAGDMIYFSPMLHYTIAENPFKLAERKYPVDYAHPFEEVYVLSFELPDGFAIEELPEVTNLVLPDKAGKFTYTAKELSNNIQIMVRFKIDKPFFSFEQYPFLKEFYNLIVEKYSEQIVLKRKT